MSYYKISYSCGCGSASQYEQGGSESMIDQIKKEKSAFIKEHEQCKFINHKNGTNKHTKKA